MKEFEIEIKETLAMTVTIEAENQAKAREMVERKWKDGDYVLDADHFQDVTFKYQRNRDYER